MGENSNDALHEIRDLLVEVKDQLKDLNLLEVRRERDRIRKRLVRGQIPAKEAKEEKRENPPIPPFKGKEEEREEKSPQRARELNDFYIDWAFARFWAKYPSQRKTKKAACRGIFSAAARECGVDAIMQGLARWTHCPDWTEDNGFFVMSPFKWLRNREWESEISTEPRPPRLTFREEARQREEAEEAERKRKAHEELDDQCERMRRMIEEGA